MTISFLFFFTICLFLSNDTCHRWPSKLQHLFSVWGLFWKVGLLTQGCLGHFCPKRGSWLKSISEKWVILVNMSQDINQRWFQGIAVLGFCSAHGKGLAGLKLLASLDAYQITKCQFFSKTRHFLLPDFRRIRESLQIRNLMANCLRRRDQMVYSIFSKSCLSGHQGFQKISKWKKVFIKMDSLPTVITNSFRIPVVQKFENIFTHIFIFSCTRIYSLFISNNKIHDDKMRLKQVYSFHTNADIKVKFTFFKSVWKHSWSKDKQKLPLVDPLS